MKIIRVHGKKGHVDEIQFIMDEFDHIDSFGDMEEFNLTQN
jgi:hypothetical protein